MPKKAFIVVLFVVLLSPLLLSLNVEATTNWCEIGVPYRAVDGLTVTLHSFDIVEKTGSYQYIIEYMLENKNPDEKIDEGAFKLYYRDTTGGSPQYGFFGSLFPGDSITRSYTFEELKSKPFDVLEYSHDNFFSSEPLEDSLKWKVIYPDDTPPVTEHDYDGSWRNADFIIMLTATDNINGIAETYYQINDGSVKAVGADGQPLITSEGANNTLEYWSVDNAGNEELPHKILSGIKLDKTVPTIGTPSRMPEGNVESDQKVRVLVNVTDSLSGVKDVTLSYDLNDTAVWVDLPMTFNSTTGLYEAAIPGESAYPLVRYKIMAHDNVGNQAVNDNQGDYYTYHVILITYQLTITSTEGGTTDPSPGTYTYLNGTLVSVTAIPNVGYSFDYWRLDGEVRTENPKSVVMDMNHTLEAFFVDDIPPSIGSPVQDPAEDVEPHQTVTVTVNVTDDGTGLYNATLWYDIDNGTTWTILNMMEISTNNYQAAIRGYENCTGVTYKIIAYDNAGNNATKDNNGYYYKYHVIPEFPSTIILPVLMLTTLIATILLKKKRKTKTQLH